MGHRRRRLSELAPWDPGQAWVQFRVARAGSRWRLASGDVSMAIGDTTKTHTVTDLTVTEVNEAADTVSGTTTFGSDWVQVWDLR